MQDWQTQVRNLAESRADVAVFYDQFLRIVAEASDGVTAMAWDCTTSPYSMIGRQPSHSSSQPFENQLDHDVLLDRVAAIGKPILVKPQVDGSGDPVPRPVIVLAPVQRNGAREIIEVFFHPNQPEEKYSASLKSIYALCDEVSKVADPEVSDFRARVVNEQDIVEPSSTIPLLELGNVDGFIHDVHRSLDWVTTCYSVANQTQRFLCCDRVSVVRFHRDTCQAIAISGQVSVNRRSNSVRLLENIARRVLVTGQILWYPSEHDRDEDAVVLPQIEKPLHDYLLESSVRTLAILPIWSEPESDDPVHEDPEAATRRKVVGGLIVEHFARQLPREQFEPAARLAVRHGGAAYRNALRHRELFLFPVWDWLGKSKALTTARNLPKVATAGVVLLFILATLVFFPASFSVSSPGVLVPQTRRNVFTQVDGVIDEVLVAHGSSVEAGQPLVLMRSDELAIEFERIAGQIDTLQEQIQSIDGLSLSYNRRESENPTQLENSKLERQSLSKRVESLRRQKTLLEDQMKRLSITSPIKGQVITWNVDERLLSRPVAKGRSLLEVAEVGGPWVIELDLPDRRIGYVREAQRRSNEPLRVTFILAADPRKSLKGKILDISRATEADPEKGQTVRVTVELDSPTPLVEQVRTDVSAKIHCGRRSLGFVWFHDIFEFVNSKILFPLG